MNTPPKQGFDAIVIGAGAYGTSVAFHLAAGGFKVALLDRHPFASQTSPRAAGLAVQVRTLPEFGQIAKRSVDLLESFAEHTGQPLRIHQTGSVAIARDDASETRVREHPALGQRCGVEVRLIDAGEASSLAPYADFRDARAISYTPTDLHLEPGDLPRAYLEAARKRGLVGYEGCDVSSLLTKSGRVVGVVTDQGTLHADLIINCAGGWIAALRTADGSAPPVQVVRHQLIVTEPLQEVSDEHASVRVVDANVYARPCWGGLLFGGYESAPVFVAPEELPGSVTDLQLDEDGIAELRRRVRHELALLEHARVRELRGGLPTLTADGHPIIDQVPGADGFYVIGGCNVGGLSTSPAVGEAVARWIADGTRPSMLEPFRIDRFDGLARAELERAAREKYTATEYG